MLVCSCGEAANHIVARGKTFDEVAIVLWHDGMITGRLGTYPRGLAPGRWKFIEHEAGALAWADASLYDWSELGALFKAARRAVTQKTLMPREYMRRAMKAKS